jgi:hypothetical protein
MIDRLTVRVLVLRGFWRWLLWPLAQALAARVIRMLSSRDSARVDRALAILGAASDWSRR